MSQSDNVIILRKVYIPKDLVELMRIAALDILVFLGASVLFYVFVSVSYGPLLLKSDMPFGRGLYHVAYSYSPILAFVFVLMAASYFARYGIVSGTIVGTLSVFLWPTGVLFRGLLSDRPCCEGGGFFFVFILPAVALVLSFVVAIPAKRIWRR